MCLWGADPLQIHLPSSHAQFKKGQGPSLRNPRISEAKRSVCAPGELSGPRFSSFLKSFPPLTPSFPSNKVFILHVQTCYVTKSPRRLLLENKEHSSPTPAFLSLPSPTPPRLPRVHLFPRTSVLAPKTAAVLSRVELWRPTVASTHNYS